MVHELYVNHPLTSQKIMEILDNNPELEKITCPPSVYQRIAPKYIEALSRLGIKVEPVKKRGRPKKYNARDREAVDEMIEKGCTPLDISNTLKIPLKTVYYFNKTPLKKGRKRKYSTETIKKVHNMHKNGLSARKISDNLKIPLRSVYGLLKRKE
ncbi:MAG: resolvase [Methanobacterium sp.]|nr:resolvase [Methanobacterium sp.]